MDSAFQSAGAQRPPNLLFARLQIGEVFLHHAVVIVGDQFDHSPSQGLGLFDLSRRDLAFLPGAARGIVVEHQPFHGDQIDDGVERLAGGRWVLDGNRTRGQFGSHLFHHHIEIRTHTVHLVDIGDARNVVFVRLTPDRLRLRLHAAHSAKDGDRAIQNSQRTFHLGGKIHMAGCIDNIDAMVFPKAGDGR
ncbi:MAG: hypothetical protein BWY83_00126 [bacterium ADurb.Bin478]|nr:MAG: hypothetical protein BWY83_00126 [bacterium ADurb.Bin478]